jgi:NTP pyrophosphatase (non-canonical NTP hydrolase)
MPELEQLLAQALSKRFGGREPFQIITRLLEECGELAQEEGSRQYLM